MKRVLAGLALAGLWLLAFLLGATPERSGSPGSRLLHSVPAAWADPTAIDVLTTLLNQVKPFFKERGGGTYTATVRFTREPYFIPDYLPPYLSSSGLPQPQLNGTVELAIDSIRWKSGTITLRQPALDTPAVFSSTDGFSIDGAPYTATATASPSPVLTESPTPSPSPSVDSNVSPSPDALESASPGATESPSPALTETPSPSASPSSNANNTLYTMHPLTLLWPFQFKNTDDIKLSSVRAPELETQESRPYWVVKSNTRATTMYIWIDKDRNLIDKIQYADPQDGELVVGVYRDFKPSDISKVPEPGKTVVPEKEAEEAPSSMLTYRHLQVSKGGQDLYTAEVPTAPAIVLIVPKPRPVVTVDDQTITTVVVFTWGLILIIMLLLVGLAYYGGRYLVFLLTRQEFSKDLILIEPEGGALGNALSSLGYQVAPASMETLTEERKFLGKKPGMQLPRAVVVAPDAFALIKGYLFLLRAYVEEGGRVMVLHHSSSNANTMPFNPYFVPNMGEGKNVVLSRPNFWKRMRLEDVEGKTGHLLPREFYVEVNSRKVDLDLVQVYNQATGVRATAVGVVREGKGEYMVCQFTLADELTRNSRAGSAVARLLFMDLMDYLQARKPEKKKAGETRQTLTAVP